MHRAVLCQHPLNEGFLQRVLDEKRRVKQRVRVIFASPDGPMCTRHVMTKLPLISIKIRNPPHNLHAHGSLAATSSFDDGGEVPTAQGAGECYLSVECSYRSLESREGSFEYYAGQGGFWLRQRYPCNDQGESPGFLSTECRLKCT